MQTHLTISAGCSSLTPTITGRVLYTNYRNGHIRLHKELLPSYI